HRARHRLHQRPAAAGAQLLVPRHAAEAAGAAQVHPPPGERPPLPGRPLPAGRPHGHDQPAPPAPLQAPLVGRAGTAAGGPGALRAAVEAEGAKLALVAPSVTGVTDSAGTALTVDETVEGGPSVLFDAVALVPTKDGAHSLARSPAARQFVADAHGHAKFVG